MGFEPMRTLCSGWFLYGTRSKGEVNSFYPAGGHPNRVLCRVALRAVRVARRRCVCTLSAGARVYTSATGASKAGLYADYDAEASSCYADVTENELDE